MIRVLPWLVISMLLLLTDVRGLPRRKQNNRQDRVKPDPVTPQYDGSQGKNPNKGNIPPRFGKVEGRLFSFLILENKICNQVLLHRPTNVPTISQNLQSQFWYCLSGVLIILNGMIYKSVRTSLL
jgi:hypothetical protein